MNRTCLLGLLAMLAATCSFAYGQSYTRTETAGSYSERSGTGSDAAIWTDDGYDDGCRFVPLPWDFSYFDRTYKACWMNTNGRIHFNDLGPDDYSYNDMTPPVTNGANIETINVYGGDITGLVEWELDGQFTVHYESDRVVFQWRNVSMYESDLNGVRLNFQCHLFPSGEIRYVMGPSSFVIVNDFEEYVSGLVNSDGTEAVAGFGNVLTVQTAPPADGTEVSLVPSGFTQADGVVVGPRWNADYSNKVVYEGATDVVVGQFCLQANGTGDTVTDITVRHDDPGTSDTLTLKLYADAGTLGVVDGADTLIDSQSMGTSSSTTFTGLTETLDGTTPLRNYILAVDVTAVDEEFDSYFYMDIDDGHVTASGDVWGGYFRGDSASGIENPEFLFLEGPFVEYTVSRGEGGTPTIQAGGSEMAVASFEAALRESNAASVELNSFEADLNLNGSIVIGDIAMVNLYRDNGTVGVLDGNDVQIASVANPATSTITFSSLTESMTADGRDYIITIMVGTSFTSLTPADLSVSVMSNNGSFTPSGAFWRSCNNNTTASVNVLPNAAQIFLSPTDATRFEIGADVLPLPQGATDIPVVHFTLQATMGSQTVTGLDFTGDGTELSDARLYLDDGNTPGRVDAGDTLVTGTVALTGTNVTFTGMSETITVTPSRYLLALDISATAATGTNLQYDLTPANVTAAVGVQGGTAEGSVTAVDMTTDGVDVTVNLVTGNGSVSGSGMKLIATCQQTPRGSGGNPTQLHFTLLNAWGGVGERSLQLVTYLEGNGPVGQLDPSDTLMVFSDSSLTSDAIAYWGGGSIPWVDTTRNFLVFLRLRPDACDFDGRFQVVFRGLQDGTNPAFASEPNYQLIGGTAQITPSSSGGGGGGGDDGCSTSENSSLSWLLLLGALSTLVVASRLRRSRA